MDEAERAFRDALHRVDSVKIPMPSLEAGEVRRSRGRGLVVGRWLAAAAALALVAGLGVWALSVRGYRRQRCRRHRLPPRRECRS